MRNKFRKILINNLDNKIMQLPKIVRPEIGWIKSVRVALGMTQKQLAKRLNISMQSISQLETNEADDSITLNSLKKAAEALGCELHYYITPRQEKSLKKLKEKQAFNKAENIIKSVDHTMLLESQRVPNNSQKIKELAIDLLDKTSTELWDE